MTNLKLEKILNSQNFGNYGTLFCIRNMPTRKSFENKENLKIWNMKIYGF
jgi:hypothetical protein